MNVRTMAISCVPKVIALCLWWAGSDAAAPVINEVQRLLASDPASGDSFGVSVAVDGDMAIVGAWRDDANGHDSGAAYVFVRNGGVWSQQAKLTPNDGASGDTFGFAVAIDRETAVIGAHQANDNAPHSGSAYVFTRINGTWTQEAKLRASDAEPGDLFGGAVAINGDTALIGTPGDDDNGSNSGSAYVFSRRHGAWTQEAKLVASDGGVIDFFGGSVAVSRNTAVIGSIGAGAGAAYVFTRVRGAWTQQAKLTASDTLLGDDLGCSVAIDGDTAIVGLSRSPFFGLPGAAYVFTRNNGIWTQQAKLVGSDTQPDDYFGTSVAVRGRTALVAASQKFGNAYQSGAAYVFTRKGAVWSESAKLIASDGQPFDDLGDFGRSVDLSGRTIFAGANLVDDTSRDQGAAYVFVLPADDDDHACHGAQRDNDPEHRATHCEHDRCSQGLDLANATRFCRDSSTLPGDASDHE